MDIIEPNLSILPATQRSIWPKLAAISTKFVLYGGTAIALQLGHRQSIDFDLFSSKSFLPEHLAMELAFLQIESTLQYQPNTLTVLTENNVKLSFFGGLSLGRVKAPKIASDNQVRLASLLDMLAIKLKVILQRAEAKDYLDIEALLNSGLKLEDGLASAVAIYGKAFPVAESIKALTYFEEGDLKTLPAKLQEMLRASTRTIKAPIVAMQLQNSRLDG